MNVVISGGGIGGLVAAIALRQRGIDIRLLERAPELCAAGAGITLWMNAMKVLRTLGIADAVAAAGEPVLDADIRTWQGRILTRSLAHELVSKYGELIIALHRTELQRVLLDALGEGVLRLGAECTGFTQDANGVTVRLADGTNERADAFIGADGLQSMVRMALPKAAEPQYAGYTAWRGVIPFHDTPAGFESWGRGQRFGFTPIGRGQAYWFATANTAENSQNAGGNKAELLLRFGQWHDPIPQAIEHTAETAILRNDIYDLKPREHWGEGRVTLLGDAAHAMTPNLGQGACQAMEDAVVLAECLDQTRDVPEALRAYERVRIPRTTMVSARSHRLGQIGQFENPTAIWLRDRIMGITPVRLQLRQIEPVVEYNG